VKSYINYDILIGEHYYEAKHEKYIFVKFLKTIKESLDWEVDVFGGL